MAETPTKTTQTIIDPSRIYVFMVKEGNYCNEYNITGDSLEAAIKEAQEYCAPGTHRRFIHVRPFITDLKKRLLEKTKEP